VRRYLILVPRGGDEALFEQLERLAAREPSRFHVVVPRWPQVNAGAEPAAEKRLAAVVGTLVARGLAADGEVGEVSVVGSVARAAERARYDALVVPFPETAGVDTLNLGVACRLHQIDIPELVMVTSAAATVPWNGPYGPGRQ
jgi:hypothetical protein